MSMWRTRSNWRHSIKSIRQQMARQAFFFLLLISPSAADDNELTKDTYEHWKKYILPTEKELAYEKLNWHLNLNTAVAEAKKLDKPILLWSYNGPPIGSSCENGVGTKACFSDENVHRLADKFVFAVDDVDRLKEKYAWPNQS